MVQAGKPAGVLDENPFPSIIHTCVIFGTLLGCFLLESKVEEIDVGFFFCSSDPILDLLWGPWGDCVTVAVVLYWLHGWQQHSRAYPPALWESDSCCGGHRSFLIPHLFHYGRRSSSPGRLIWQGCCGNHSWSLSLRPPSPAFQLYSGQDLSILNPFFLKIARMVLFPSVEPCQV